MVIYNHLSFTVYRQFCDFQDIFSTQKQRDKCLEKTKLGGNILGNKAGYLLA